MHVHTILELPYNFKTTTMKFKQLIFIIIISVSAFSCKKFFDVMPKDKVYENELYKDRYGFETAIAGVYNSVAGASLYGRELKYGFLETLVGYYNAPSSGHAYYNAYRFEYMNASVQPMINSIWTSMYANINKLNIILSNVDNIKKDPYYNIVKGEAMGMRALLHFELLKLFGPTISKEGLSAKAIPYRDSVIFTPSKFTSAEEIIQKINADVAAAKQLLDKDPIRSSFRTANGNQFGYERYNSLIDRRGIRFNYYAALALSALVKQWSGDVVTAGQEAETLISELNTTGSMALATASSFGSNTSMNDIRTSTENILGLHSSSLRTSALNLLPDIADTRAVVNPLLYPNYTWLNANLYAAAGHGSTNDFRLASWFQNNVRWKLTKYAIPESFNPIISIDPGSSTYLQVNAFEIKILSLHTIYLVAAESYIKSNPQKAIDYLNVLRRTRGLTTDIVYNASYTNTQIQDLLFLEFRKENIGYGTLFAEYKRLYKAIDRATPVQPSVSIFNFPIPAGESLYNPN